MTQLHAWAVARSRQRIIHQRSSEESPLLIVDELLEKSAAQTLNRATDDLPLHQHRIDHHAAVMRHDIFLIPIWPVVTSTSTSARCVALDQVTVGGSQ